MVNTETSPALTQDNRAIDGGPIHEALTKSNHPPITGAPAIDRTIHDICPFLRFCSSREIEHIGGMITDHILGKRILIRDIGDRTNPETIKIIEGLAMIAKSQGITDIIGIENYIIGISDQLDAHDICGID